MALAITGFAINMSGDVTFEGTNMGNTPPTCDLDGTAGAKVNGPGTHWEVTFENVSTGHHVFHVSGGGKDLELPFEVPARLSGQTLGKWVAGPVGHAH